jgi:serine/threonine-protein kinase HipA
MLWEHTAQMTLAREVGLPVASVQKITLPGQVALAVKRFDRRWQGAILKRLPQEDICQALGFSSARKYQKSSGPSIRQIMELLREADDPTWTVKRSSRRRFSSI